MKQTHKKPVGKNPHFILPPSSFILSYSCLLDDHIKATFTRATNLSLSRANLHFNYRTEQTDEKSQLSRL